MGKKRCKRWNSCMMWFITSMGALFYTCASLNVDATDEPVVIEPKSAEYTSYGTPHHGTTTSSCPAPKSAKKEDFLVVVSTLDGKLSALDVKNKGELVWSIDADTKPLLSSSISKLEITRNRMKTRLIPSLDGGLYQYDGESIEAIPMTAETLLSSTYRISERLMMIGGKDIKSYGIDPTNGQLRYACTANDCQFFGETQVTDDDDIMVVTRVTQTVRAVDSRTGSEKWNFSVGSHELEFLPGDKIPSRYVEDDDEDDVNIISCPADGTNEIDDFADFESTLKIIVPKGMVVSLNPENPNEFNWQYKFSSPVANAWLLHKGVLKSISVFDNKHIPAISDSDSEEPHIPRQPLLYVGLHHSQLYVQPSMKFKENIHKAAAAANSGTNLQRTDVPRVAWKPYLHTPSRTPLFRGNKRNVPMITNRGEQDDNDDDDGTALTVWHENYPFDNGYYLYPDNFALLPGNDSCESGNDSCDSEQTEENSSAYESVVIVSLFYYWREVVAISIATSVIVNILLYKLKHKKDALLAQLSCSGSSEQMTNSVSVENLNRPAEEYVSRYKTDFDHVQCLGKGGFGIVFEAKNKVDDCHYAVKRISLPNREAAKEKVMREVKALAKLDNVGIVRYFHAWVESPPLGWQEAQDKHLEDSEITGIPTPCNSVTQMSTVPLAPDKLSEPVLDLENPFGGNGVYDFSSSRNKAAGGSSEFSVNESINFEESSSFGILAENLNQIQEEDHEVHFQLSDSEDSGSCSKNIPYQNLYSTFQEKNVNTNNDSFSIVFEDSGCADKSGGNSANSENSMKERDKTTDFHIDISNSSRLTNIVSSSNQNSFSKLEKTADQSERDEKNSADQTVDKSSVSKRSSASPSPKLYLFIQMQLCRRETLKDWLAANNLPRDMNMMKVVLDIFDQIVSAVAYVHSCGLMHRDLKPSNIFFSVEGLIKVGDFGLVTDLTEQELELCSEGHNNPYKRHTAQVGTQLYMSLEQINGKLYSHKVDVFSLGIILFELLHPFSTQMERIKTLIGVKERKFPEKFMRENPVECKFVERLLSPDPCDRFSAQEILDSDLLKDFHVRHASNRIRHRTTSSSSSGSLGLNHE